MMPEPQLDNALHTILTQYGKSFSAKAFAEESAEEDDLMLVFGLTQAKKAENKQYWGRELGMCWQRLIVELCRQRRVDFRGPLKEGLDEICDLIVGHEAIDTKYRIGSGDSGTLKKFKQYGVRLTELKYKPILLILRNDNLPAAKTACVNGGWTVFTGEESFKYLERVTGFDLKLWLQSRRGYYGKMS